MIPEKKQITCLEKSGMYPPPSRKSISLRSDDLDLRNDVTSPEEALKRSKLTGTIPLQSHFQNVVYSRRNNTTKNLIWKESGVILMKEIAKLDTQHIIDIHVI